MDISRPRVNQESYIERERSLFRSSVNLGVSNILLTNLRMAMVPFLCAEVLQLQASELFWETTKEAALTLNIPNP